MPTSSDQYINFRDLCERCKFAVKIASPLTFLKCSFVARLSKESFGFQPVLLEKRDENFSNWLAFVATHRQYGLTICKRCFRHQGGDFSQTVI